MTAPDYLSNIRETALYGRPVGDIPFFAVDDIRYLTDDQDIWAAAMLDQYPGAVAWRDAHDQILITMPDGETTYYLNRPGFSGGDAQMVGSHFLRNQYVPTEVAASGGALGGLIGSFIPIPWVGTAVGAYLGQWAARELYKAWYDRSVRDLEERYGDYTVPPPNFTPTWQEFNARFNGMLSPEEFDARFNSQQGLPGYQFDARFRGLSLCRAALASNSGRALWRTISATIRACTGRWRQSGIPDRRQIPGSPFRG